MIHHEVRKEVPQNPTMVQGVPSTYLFGDNLSESIKIADETKKLTKKVNSYDNYRQDNYKSKKQQSSYQPKVSHKFKNKKAEKPRDQRQGKDSYQNTDKSSSGFPKVPDSQRDQPKKGRSKNRRY